MTQEELTRKRASRYKRLTDPPRMRLTVRDKQVVKAVNDFRVMRQDQVRRLLFPSKNTAQVRLWLLWQHGYLKREFLPVIGGIQTSPILYVLDKRGVQLLRDEFDYNSQSLRWSRGQRLSQQFLEHTLGLSEIRLAVTLSCRKGHYQLETWRDEKALRADYDKVQLGRRLVAVLPDAYFVVRIPAGELHFFLEYDRGLESLKYFKGKMAAYVAYFRSGKCEARYGTDRIRVLTVNEGGRTGVGRRRLNNLRRVTEEVEGRHRFWFSSLADVASEDALSASIWRVAGNSRLTPLLLA
jgi:hypothetical protein